MLVIFFNVTETLTPRKLFLSWQSQYFRFIYKNVYSAWSCNAYADLKLISQKENGEMLSRSE